MRKLTCPYCFEEVARSKVPFRCRGRAAGQKGCAEEADDTNARFTGRAAEIRPPVFQADGRRARAECPRCGLESTQRVCPECHSNLPGSYCDADSRIVALIGAKGAGKSTYIAVLVHELENRIGAELDASLVACDDRTRTRYHEEFRAPLYDRRELLPVTQSAAAGLNSPLLYTLTRRRHGRGMRRGNHAITLVLFDNAGEDFTTEAAVGEHLRYLGGSDAVVFLVDPQSLSGTDAIDVVGRVTEMLRAQHGVPAGRMLRTPVAVALTKLDALLPELPPQSPLRQRRPSSGLLDQQDVTAVHEEVRGLLDAWEARQLDLHLEHSFRTFSLFALSALGNVPNNGAVSPVGIQPHRVEDPLLWLLHEFGMLRATRRTGRR